MQKDSLLKKQSFAVPFSVTLIVLLLCAVGLTNLYSAGNSASLFNNQLRHLGLGFLCFLLVGWVIPLRLINTYSYPFFVFISLSLVIVLIIGSSAGGAQRWISLGPIRFQPSEMAKLSMVLLMAKFFYNNKTTTRYDIASLWPVLAAGFLMFALIFKQPDFGTAGVCLLIPAAQLFFIRVWISWKTILALIITGMVSAVCGWFFFLHSYQKLRILNLFNPDLDPSGSGYNSLQSLVAIGSGQQFGKGFMQGTQTQLQFLPARHTDFIFSVFAEEHGFWGGLAIFILFTVLSYLALEIARHARDTFGILTAIGVSALFFIEFSINVAMVLGIFPVGGMPLPFFSYGGSSLITLWASVGILIAIDRDSRKTH